MGDQDLQISITAVDEASGTLENVAAAAEGMATTIDEAAASIQGVMTESLTAAEEAAVDAAITTANAWMGAEETITTAATVTAETMTEEFDAVAMASRAAAVSTVPTWEASLAEIAALGAMTEAEVEAEFAAMGVAATESAGKATGAMTSMHGYFRMLIAGYLAETAGHGLLSGVEAAVTAAAGDPTKLQQLQDQLAQQQAALQKLELPISGKGKTTAELLADEAEQSAKIATAKDKIAALQKQIEPLAAAQDRAGQATRDYATAVDALTTAWQTFLSTVGTPLLEHLATAAAAMARIVVAITAWAAAHPSREYTAGTTPDVYTTVAGQLVYHIAYKYTGSFFVTLDGVQQSIGIDQQDDPGLFETLYNSRGPFIKFTSDPGDGHTLKVYGFAQIPIVAHSQDSTSIGAYGEYQDSIIDPQISSVQEAQERAAAELVQFGHPVYDVKFDTLTPGMEVGQTVILNSVKFGVSTYPLIVKRVESHGYSNDKLIYSVEAIGSDVVTFTDTMLLLLQQQNAQTSVDPSTVLQILLDISENVLADDDVTITATGPHYVYDTAKLGLSKFS